MNLEIRTESTQFPEKEYINGIILAVYVGDGWISSAIGTGGPAEEAGQQGRQVELCRQGVTKRCRLSLLTNSASPNAGGGRELRGLSQ
jgi:hypothetical protein